MELFTLDGLLSLLLIIGIDLVLAGDNAIVIGLSARKLPEKQQKKAIIWGTVGAVTIRVVATLLVVTLLKIPMLHLIGGILLVWIAYKLLVDNSEHDNVPAASNLWGAIRTIVIADALMGLDNVLAIAGAAGDSYLLVIIGLLISVPIIMWGSSLFIRLTERFPWVIYIGSGILAFTAAKMIIKEPFVHDYVNHFFIKALVILIIVAGVVLTGVMRNRRSKANADVKDISAS